MFQMSLTTNQKNHRNNEETYKYPYKKCFIPDHKNKHFNETVCQISKHGYRKGTGGKVKG